MVDDSKLTITFHEKGSRNGIFNQYFFLNLFDTIPYAFTVVQQETRLNEFI